MCFCLFEVFFVTTIFLILLIDRNSLHMMDAYPYIYILNTDFLPILPFIIFVF